MLLYSIKKKIIEIMYNVNINQDNRIYLDKTHSYGVLLCLIILQGLIIIIIVLALIDDEC
jgi:hypothetical protein